MRARRWSGTAMPPATRSFSVFSILQPALVKGFASVIMDSANFEDRLLHALWGKSLSFKEDNKLKAGLRFDRHNGSRATINAYLKRPWSRSLALKNLEDGTTYRDAMLGVMTEGVPPGRPYLIALNADHDPPLPLNADLLPAIPHGHNRFSDRHRVVFRPRILHRLCRAETTTDPD